MKEKRVLGSILCILVSALIFTLVYRVWNRDFSVPFDYEGDAIGALVEFKGCMDGETTYYNSFLAAPFGLDNSESLYFNGLFLLFVRILSLVIKDVGVLANAFYCIISVLISLLSYWVMKKLNISTLLAICLSLSFAFSPFRVLHGESHIWVSSYCFVPFLIFMALKIWRNDDEIKWNISYLFELFVFVLLGFSDIYYTCFSCFIITFAILYNWRKEIRNKNIVKDILYIFAMMSPPALSFLYKKATVGISGNLAEAGANRAVSTVDFFSLNIAELFLPTLNNKYEIFKKVRIIYETALGNNQDQEVLWISLGCISSIGFFYLLIHRIYHSDRNDEYNFLFGMIMFIIFLAIAGGVSNFVALFITKLLKAYCRLAVYIHYCCLLAVGFIVTDFKNLKINIAFFGVCIFLIFAQLPDDVSDAGSYYENGMNAYYVSRTEAEMKWNTYKDFVAKIEEHYPDHRMIICYPFMEFTNVYPNGNTHGYNMLIPYLVSDKIRWSVGDSENGKSRLWTKEIERESLEQQIEQFEFYGFDGIYIDTNGMDDSKSLLLKMEKFFGCPIVSRDGSLYYFPMH